MRRTIELVLPTADARYVVCYSFADGGDGGRYYDVHKPSNMLHEQTILAYEMIGAPVSVLHGAPLRLRCENGLGFKMMRWIAAIEFVHDFADLGAGQGSHHEDHEFFAGVECPVERGSTAGLATSVVIYEANVVAIALAPGIYNRDPRLAKRCVHHGQFAAIVRFLRRLCKNAMFA